MSGLSSRASGAGGRPATFLILESLREAGRKSATAAVITTASRSCRHFGHGPLHVAGVAHRADRDAGGIGQLDVRRHHGHLGPARGSHQRDGVALPSRGVVAEVADRIERLAGASGADHDPSPLEITGQRAGAGQEQGGSGGDVLGVRQAARPRSRRR